MSVLLFFLRAVPVLIHGRPDRGVLFTFVVMSRRWFWNLWWCFFAPWKFFQILADSFYTVKSQNWEEFSRDKKAFDKVFQEIDIARFARQNENFFVVFKHSFIFEKICLLGNISRIMRFLLLLQKLGIVVFGNSSGVYRSGKSHAAQDIFAFIRRDVIVHRIWKAGRRRMVKLG